MKKLIKLKRKLQWGLLVIAFMLSGSLLNSCSKSNLKDNGPVSYVNVFLIGDATPAVWTVANAINMTQTAPGSGQFTWTGPLVAGQLKFLTASNFSSDTFAPLTADAPVTTTTAQLTGGSPDLKWKLAATDAGTYKITVDTKTPSVTFVKQ